MATLLPDYSLPGYMLQLIYPPARRLTAKVRLFSAFLTAYFSDDVSNDNADLD